MLTVIPFCAKDEESCLANLRLAIMFDGDSKPFGRCLLTHDTSTPPHRVKALAEKLFKQVLDHQYPTWNGSQSWPTPQNWAWQCAARYISKVFTESWFWWEADAIPLKPGWITMLEEAHYKGGKPFSGHIVEGMGHMTGVGIYPANVPGLSADAMITRAQPFDVFLGSVIRNRVNPINRLIQHVWNLTPDLKPTRDLSCSAPSFPTQKVVQEVVSPLSVIFHRCKDLSLSSRLAESYGNYAPEVKASKSKLAFSHSGDLGDIIYALPSIKALGGGSLTLTSNARTRVPMTLERARVITPLLEAQPYISEVRFSPSKVEAKSFDPFVDKLIGDEYQYGESSANIMAKVVGADPKCTEKAWLTVDHPIMIKGKPIVINRSLRYRNHLFSWDKIRDYYGKKAIFVGLRDEYELFMQEVKWKGLEFFKTENLMEVARLIAGCSFFFGNQSAPYAIAEGLKKNRCQEVFKVRPDCLFTGNAIPCWDENIQLPPKL